MQALTQTYRLGTFNYVSQLTIYKPNYYNQEQKHRIPEIKKSCSLMHWIHYYQLLSNHASRKKEEAPYKQSRLFKILHPKTTVA
jgi:hypothetical protein